MPTHQSLAGSSDEELLRRMVDTHADRYGDTFWAFFTTAVAPALPTRPVIIEPLPVLAEIRRVLAPRGIFLLHDWIRQPLAAYLAYRRDDIKETGPDAMRRGFRLFPVHNKYTSDDWRWLLAEAGLALRDHTQLRASHLIFVAG